MKGLESFLFRQLSTIFLFTFLFLFSQNTLAQCCCATNLGSISPNLTWQYYPQTCHGYLSFQAQAGCTYQFTYCQSTAPGASYTGDTYLTINSQPTTGIQTSNDDYCGLGSYISWTAPATATYYIQLGSWAQGATCACGLSRVLGYRSTNCAGGVSPPTSITASSNTICSGQTVTLTANGAVGTQTWYTGSCQGTQIGTGQNITVTPLVTTTYFVNNFSGGNFSPSCAQVTITVIAAPLAPQASGQTLCGPGQATLTATGGANYVWCANSNGTGQLANTQQYTTPVLQNTTTYYVGIAGAGVSTGQQTFNYTGAPQTFTAPATGNYTITLTGARGGNGLNTQGGLGGQATGSLALTAGQTINIYIGGQGGNSGGLPGWNGGGQGGVDIGAGQHAGSGGGASDIRVGGTALANRVIVAAGGAGGGRDGATGVGGGTSGTASANFSSGYGGTGGTQVAGGLAWTLTRGATNGTLGQGGAGSTGYNAAGGGGGGGGYWGGGGGTSTQNHGQGWSAGGGGGSSFIGGVVGGSTTPGVGNGNGSGTISWNINAGCPSQLTPVTVTVNPIPVINTSGATICQGQTAQLTATSTTPGGSWSWQPGNLSGSQITVSPNSTQQYTVTYTVPGCASVTQTVLVTVNAIPNPPTVANQTLCGPGQATLTASGLNTYLWFSNQNGTGQVANTATWTTQTLQTTTQFWVSGQNAQNCTSQLVPVTVQINPIPQVTTIGDTVCLGQQATILATSTVGGGTWLWNPTGLTSSQINVTPNQTTTYTVTYSVPLCPNVSSQATVIVNPLQPISGNLQSCVGQTSQLSNPVASGSWSSQNPGVATVSQSGVVTGVSPGVTQITYLTNTGCSTTSQFIVYPVPVLSVSSSNVLCFGGTGSVILQASQANAPYTYGGSPTTNLSPGTYTYFATSIDGCVSSPVSITITQPQNPLTLQTTHIDVLCFGNATGSINLTPAGGTSPYTYLWSNGSTVEDPTGLSAGTYQVTVTDTNGCVATTSVTINQPQAALSLTTTHIDVFCFGNTTGSINLTPSGGTSPYTYLWSNGSTVEDPTGLSAGTYQVTVTDANGCVATTSVTINQPQNPLTLQTTHIDVLCFGNATGSINLTPAGGTSPYTYLWSNGSTVEDPTGLSAGTYQVTVTDANGCVATTSVIISQPQSAVFVTTQPQNILCAGGTGSVNSTVSGGVLPYTFLWSNGLTTQNISNLGVGNYQITIQDANGCQATSQSAVVLSLSQLPVQILNLTATTTLTCLNPSITLQATGGVSYVWTGGLTPQNDTNIITTPGTYTVNMIDPNGCPVSQTITITQNITPPIAAITNISGTTIIDCNSPTITLQATGGGTYQWNQNLGTQSMVSVSTAGTYLVVVTAANGCVDSASVIITVAPVPQITTSNTTICSGQTVTLTPQYFPASGQVIWSTGQQTQSITVSPNTTTQYSILYTWNGCQALANILVTVNPIPQLNLSTDTICFGETTQLVATPNLLGGSWLWSSGQTTQTITVSPQINTSWSCQYTLNGCQSGTFSTQVIVTVLPQVVVNPVSICVGQSATLIANANPAGGTFLWSQGSTTSQITESPQVTTSYSVVYTANGCQSNPVSSQIVVNSLPNASFVADTLTGCVPVTVNFEADTVGQLAVYNWSSTSGAVASGPQVNMTFNNGGCYSITLTANQGGCINSTTQTNLICVEDYPTASFIPNPPVFTEINQLVNFNNTSSGATGLVWNFGDGTFSSQQYPSHLFSGTTSGFTVTLIATTQMGCQDSISVLIPANLAVQFYIPNTFTPDGDKFNQTFVPTFSNGVSKEDYKMLIYNRWGEILFESLDPQIGWDGSYGIEGLDCQSGTYTYKISYRPTNQAELITLTGHVNLLR